MAGLTDEQKAAWEPALAAAGEAAASTLGGLLGKSVSLSPGGMSELTAADLGDKFFAGVAQVGVTLAGQAKGKALFLFNESAAALMADLMIGGDGSAPPETLSDLHLSAVGEVGSQMSAAFLEALGSSLGKTVSGQAADLASAQPSDLAGLAGALGPDLVAGEYSLDIEGGMPSPFLFLLGSATAAALGGANGAGAGAPAAGGSFSSPDFGGGSMNAPVVQAAQMSQLAAGLTGSAGNNLELLMDVPLQVTVELGRTEKMVKEVLALGPGSVLELDKLAGEPVDILVNEKLIAKGEVVVIDENFGIRVTEILAPKDRVSF